MPQRKIIHIDMDCFYAAVEIRDNPSLKNRPVAVGGHHQGRGVLTTANYIARKFGIRSAMPTSRALRLCPDLVLVPVHFEKYRRESQIIKKIFQNFTAVIEPLSLDEAYLDVSKSSLFEGSATKIAYEIRRQIFKNTALTASAGIAPNKFLAKVASDWKKPNGQYTIEPSRVDNFVLGLSVGKIPGVGKVTQQKMQGLGIKTCKDLQSFSQRELMAHFGVFGRRLYDVSRGIDQREVIVSSIRKSISVENTFGRDLETLQDCLGSLPQLLVELQQRLKKGSQPQKIKSLVVKVKFFDFQQTTVERASFKEPKKEFFENLIKEAFSRREVPVRLIGIGVKLDTEDREEQNKQLQFF